MLPLMIAKISDVGLAEGRIVSLRAKESNDEILSCRHLAHEILDSAGETPSCDAANGCDFLFV